MRKVFLFYVFEIPADEGFPSWQVICFVCGILCLTFLRALPLGFQSEGSTCTRGSPSLRPSVHRPGGLLTAGVTSQTRALIPVGRAGSAGVFMHRWVCMDVHSPQHSKTTALVDFLEINCFRWHYLDTGERLLPRSLATYHFSSRKQYFSVFMFP